MNVLYPIIHVCISVCVCVCVLMLLALNFMKKSIVYFHWSSGECGSGIRNMYTVTYLNGRIELC